ncbi:ATP-binding protein [Streptomyces sp. WAC04770]|nr:ATP-binding protein [Streptomyces sp. WAC04770]RST25312.1 ATP-binding protein [Streptomyces sp. WAC04770]
MERREGSSDSQVGGPVVYLLVGLTGSGKTTYAQRKLEPAGVVRLSVDEIVARDHGRYGVDYPESEYFEREAPAVAEVRSRLVDLVGQGRDVVVDHGLWTRQDREEWRKLVEDAGGRPRLLYFPVDREELLRRLTARNRRTDANALAVTESALSDFVARFEPPHGEGEEIVAPESF